MELLDALRRDLETLRGIELFVKNTDMENCVSLETWIRLRNAIKLRIDIVEGNYFIIRKPWKKVKE